MQQSRLRLSLYRHWSLFDSICHSRYTACRFVFCRLCQDLRWQESRENKTSQAKIRRARSGEEGGGTGGKKQHRRPLSLPSHRAFFALLFTARQHCYLGAWTRLTFLLILNSSCWEEKFYQSQCFLLRFLWVLCERLKKPTLPNSNSIWNARTRLNEFTRTPKCFVGKQITMQLTIYRVIKSQL